MRRIIHRREIVADDVRYGEEEPGSGLRTVQPAAQFIAARQAVQQATAQQAEAGVAVLIGPTDEVDSLAPYLGAISLVVVQFPKAGEGRGFSQARMLRQRYRYGGELRARGAIKRDVLFFLARCGFDSFDLDPAEDLEASLAAFDSFSVAYQDGSDAVVHVRRRAAS
jgi:uncharacterized protein (DUF934 family)